MLVIIWMNVSSLPIQLVVHNLIYVRISEFNIVGIGINEVTEIESVADVHKETLLSVSVSERHFCVQVADLVRRTSRFVLYDGRIDQVTISHKRYVPQSPETDVTQNSVNCLSRKKNKNDGRAQCAN